MMRIRRFFYVPALFVVGFVVLASALHSEVSAATEMVPMTDGTKLATDVYLPGAGGPFGAVLVRTPYNKNAMKAMAANFTHFGFALVVQDVRGRFASEGRHAIIFGNEGLGEHKDGHDTIAWVAKQPWSNGRVVTWGGSAGGIVQNMAAPGAPDALKGQIVQVAFSSYYHQAAYQGGVWRIELLERWLEGNGITEINLPTFNAHPYYDDFWKALDAESHADKVNAPGIYSGGWYDIFCQGTINSFMTVQERGGPEARGKCVLVMGPVAHGKFTELVYPPTAGAMPINPVAPVAHLATWLQGRDSGIEKIKPVHYYVMGDTTDPQAPGNVWRSEDSWPPAADITSFYLQPEGALAREAIPTGDHKLSYDYDPANPVPTIGGQNLKLPKGPMDQRSVEGRKDVLVFTSAVLARPLEVTGRIYAKLYVSSDCPDTDFAVKLCDVYPDGRSMLVTDGIRRASLRNSFEKPEPLRTGEVYEVTVDLWSTSLVFNKGHRIRISVTSSNSPRFEPNANTGDPHPVPGKTRIAHNTVYLSKDRPSHVLLPIYRGPTILKAGVSGNGAAHKTEPTRQADRGPESTDAQP